MPRRPPAEGTVANKLILAVVILLLPWLIDAQQQQQNQARGLGERFKSPPEGAHSDSIATLEATGLAKQAQRLETTVKEGRRKSTPSANIDNSEDIRNDASAIATFAPAGSAVRAPSTRRSGIENNAGLSPQTARSLEDWQVEDFVLLATVDGKLHARDRKTGTPKWVLEVDRPVVQATYHQQNRSAQDDDNHEPVDDYLWIVEPSTDGSLYIYIPGGSQPGLVNTGLTMKKLVEEMVPYADTEPSVVYTGDKVTSLLTIDARDGAILKWFGSTGSYGPGEATCVRPDGFQDPDGEECSTRGTLTLGRTEYTVGIQGKDGHPIATLKYAEWGPNNYDQDLLRQHQNTLDGKYMYSSHDGGVFAYDLTRTKDRGAIYNAKLPAPVIRVFDVARPLGADKKNPDLIVLPQPVPPLVDDSHAGIRHARIFINQTEDGAWYAMSGNSYPLVIDGPEQAQCDKASWWQGSRLHEPLNNAQFKKALVGLHSIHGHRPEPLLTISGPTNQTVQEPGQRKNKTIFNDSVANATAPALDPKPSVLHHVRQLPTRAVTSVIDLANNPITTLVLITLLLWYNKDIARWMRSFCNKYLTSFTKLSDKQETVAEEIEDFSTIDAPLQENAPPPKTIIQAVEDSDSTDDATPVATKNQDEDTISSPNETDREPLAEVSANHSSRPPKQPKLDGKKAHRGKRGGLKHKKGQRQNPSSDGSVPKPPATIEDAVRDAKKLGESTPIEPDVQTLPNGVNEISGPILRMNSLEVNTDKLIGTGSNGTMVFEGKFDGRNVAVKRMLIQFFEIASQETKLLRESDDHPNVIRYYAQQQSQGFLYIALELCSASLADVIERPQQHRDLAQGGERDLPNVLYQITNGLQHLHNLRIVHRDLKPQNILVSMGKDGKPRLLVSDFGLCKKLEGEQSSFRATTAHAAGTSGWRAPELLLDDDLRDGSITAAMESARSSSHSTSGIPLVSADVMPNRRATRAIDIFSLGLVFFYVLTKGSHPFDCGDRYMREVNIRKGQFNLHPLDVLGDYAYEARDLIGSMLEQEPKARPTATQVMAHPFFWPAKKRLNFLCDVSDHFEKEKRDPPSDALVELEKWAPEVTRGDFLRPLGKEFTDSMGKQRKYTGSRLLDLLRALRNKKNHYEDMTDKLKKDVGPLPEGYLSFWTRKFPNLLIGCWNVVYELRWDEVDRFKEYYEPAGL